MMATVSLVGVVIATPDNRELRIGGNEIEFAALDNRIKRLDDIAVTAGNHRVIDVRARSGFPNPRR